MIPSTHLNNILMLGILFITHIRDLLYVYDLKRISKRV